MIDDKDRFRVRESRESVLSAGLDDDNGTKTQTHKGVAGEV